MVTISQIRGFIYSRAVRLYKKELLWEAMSLQTVIALFYDCDLTLTPEYMQGPIFQRFKVDGAQFWREKEELIAAAKKRGINYDDECAYMNLMLQYVKSGTFPGLSNALLRELGAELPLFPGLPEFFGRVSAVVEDEKYTLNNISVEHYVISTGLKAMIEGSQLGKHLNEIFASEFEEENGVIAEIARTVGHLRKTEQLYRVNKGCNVNPEIDINGKLAEESYRVPFCNMIYVGDGPTDVPCFSAINSKGGRCFSVYDPTKEKSFPQGYVLREQERVFDFGEADFREKSHISRSIEYTVKKMADRIVREREENLRRNSAPAPRH